MLPFDPSSSYFPIRSLSSASASSVRRAQMSPVLGFKTMDAHVGKDVIQGAAGTHILGRDGNVRIGGHELIQARRALDEGGRVNVEHATRTLTRRHLTAERVAKEVKLEKGDALARIAVGAVGQHARRCIRLDGQRFAQVEARLVGAVILDRRCAVHVVDVADLVATRTWSYLALTEVTMRMSGGVQEVAEEPAASVRGWSADIKADEGEAESATPDER